MADADIEIGRNGIIIRDFLDGNLYDWNDIVGINRFKSIIFLKDGEMIKPGTLNFIKLHDFGQNEIGQGQPVTYRSWGKIFPVLLEKTKLWGGSYLEEFEVLYTSFFTILPENYHLRLVLSPEERKDRKILFFLFFLNLGLFFSIFIIHFIIFEGKEISLPIAVVLAAIFSVLWIGGIIFLCLYFRRSKILKILERHSFIKS